MKKRCLCLVLSLLMIFSMGIVPALADGSADEYHFQPDGWPTKHWVYMTQEEIADYQSKGWEMYSGVLWIGPNDEVVVQDVKTSEIQELYNKDYKLVVFYHWRCDGAKLGKYQEQSVDVGMWKLSPEQAIEYHKTYQKPQIQVDFAQVDVNHLSQWYSEGVACSQPNGQETPEELKKLNFVRYRFDKYKFGYGSDLYLARGDYDLFSYSEALQVNNTTGFQNEMPAWGARP